MNNTGGFSWPRETCLGALTRHLTSPHPDFQPMNFNFGLFPRPEGIRKSEKKQYLVTQCLQALEGFQLPWLNTSLG
jgi:folate-dependent tRNA-U54 methylase TrmFO/GidA